jgi:hypothetical protein
MGNSFELKFDVNLEQALAFDEGRFFAAVERKFSELFAKLDDKIAGKLDGEVLQRRSGLLAASVSDPTITTEGATVTGEISAASGAAFYGVIHERGGSHAYTIQPVNKDYLRALLGDGKAVFRKMFEHPPLPKRPWFDPAVEEMREEFIAGLRQAVIEGIE